MSQQREPWRVSLHGGHSAPYCDHADGSLRDMLEAAVERGFRVYGVTEHAPRIGGQFLYPEEVELGWTVAKLESNFEAYAAEVRRLAEEFADRLVVLRGFEAEVVPTDRYVELMTGYDAQHGFDYMLGSVHHVDELLVDGPIAQFEEAKARYGGFHNLAVAYYRHVASMVESLRPEVVAHFDVVRKHALLDVSFDTPEVRRAAEAALEAIRAHNCILDVNTAGYRKGLGSPYPASWLVRLAQRMGAVFCFGDDSHRPADVGAGIDDARLYLLENGVSSIVFLTREDGTLVRQTASL